jgi:hypothetical protein
MVSKNLGTRIQVAIPADDYSQIVFRQTFPQAHLAVFGRPGPKVDWHRPYRSRARHYGVSAGSQFE